MVKLEDCYTPLDIEYRPVEPEVAAHWLARWDVRLPAGSRVFRVRDGVIDLPVLGHCLARHAQALGTELVRQGVARLDIQGGVIRALILTDGTRHQVTPDAPVILACGQQIRPLLARADVQVPGLRLFRSYLVASADLGVPALLSVIGGPCLVPHDETGQLFTTIGDSYREELLPETDGHQPSLDCEAIEQVCQTAEEFFGLRLPRDDRLVAWAGIKTEIIAEGRQWSQAHHACPVPGLRNAWLAIPGKLSNAPACADDLARAVLRQRLGGAIARPFWETAAGRWTSPPDRDKDQMPISIIGGGIMGLMGAIELITLGRALGLSVPVRLYESSAFGGGPDAAAVRSQIWQHKSHYAKSLPEVSLALQRSARRFQELAPHAFRYPLALAIAPSRAN